MIVYKFGGASVSTAQGVRNLSNIVDMCNEKIVVVISAMGKTTNNLEIALEEVIKADKQASLNKIKEIEEFHYGITDSLSLNRIFIEPVFNKLKEYINDDIHNEKEYEFRYDSFISYGEMLSTIIVSKYLESIGKENKFLDMRDIMITDNNYKDASVDIEKTSQRLLKAVSMGFNIYIAQGFIGGTIDGNTTTIGREGSDYSAAIIANILSSESLTIWKDVDGVYNADPKEFPNTVLIPQLSYNDAVELAFSGAQIIHPKTIRPLENKNISLFVKSFNNPSSSGSVINSETSNIQSPILILKKNQNLISIHPKDFSFVIEDSLEDIMTRLNKYKHKVNLIQSSAVSVSVSVNDSRHFDSLIKELQNSYRVTFNKGLEILTIRGQNEEILEREIKNSNIYIRQQTRRSVRLLRKREA